MRSTVNIFLLLLVITLGFGAFILITEPKGDLVILFNRHHTLVLDKAFRWITFLGDGVWFGIVAVLFVFFRYAWSLSIIALGLLQLLLVQGLKRFIFGPVPRPAEYFRDSFVLQDVGGVSIHHFYSFPSGHTATAFGLAFMLVILIRPNRMISVVAFTIAFLIGISRIYLGQHFLEDVMAGAALGTLSAAMIGYLYGRVEQKYPYSVLFHSSLNDLFGIGKSRI